MKTATRLQVSLYRPRSYPSTELLTLGNLKGYHHGTIMGALSGGLNGLHMTDVAFIGDECFEWKATEEEKKSWAIEEAKEVLYMIRARKRAPPSSGRLNELRKIVFG